MSQPPTDPELAAALRVLARLRSDPADPALAAVRAATEQTHRAVKKHRNAVRRTARAAEDRVAVAATTRYREPVPAADAAPAPAAPAVALHHGRRCYVCKQRYRLLDADYHRLCPACAEVNRERRHARCGLTGRRALITGGRVKIGFHVALKLLRDGADVLVTTRFPRDAARRFAAVADAPDWLPRLRVHGVDLLDPHATLAMVDAVTARWDHLDVLINNAAQTVRRPDAYHREVRAAESVPLHGRAAAIPLSGGPVATPVGVPAPADRAALERLFPAGRLDETGEPLDLRATNSWTLRVDEVSPREWLETHVVNAFAPFLLTGRLRPLLAASPRPDRYVVQVSAMEGNYSHTHKTPRHPHTNMAKAGLNMLTRTLAADYATAGIFMTSVDTGWVTDERPHPARTTGRSAGFRPPLDVLDGAARVYDPVVRGVRGEPLSGVFLKDYRPVPW